MTAASPAHTTIDINSGGSATSDNLQHCIPNLVTLWNYTIRLPYYVTIERPLSGIGSTTYTYSFQCKSNSFAANIYDCVVNIQKIGGVGGGGSNQTLDEVANEFQLVQVSEDSYLIKCEKLEGKYWLNPSTKILMLCDYFPEKSAWCIRAKSHNDIVALFTLNRSGDNLGYLAPWLADTNEVHFFTDRMEMQIVSSYGSMLTLAQGKMARANGLSSRDIFNRTNSNNFYSPQQPRNMTASSSMIFTSHPQEEHQHQHQQHSNNSLSSKVSFDDSIVSDTASVLSDGSSGSSLCPTLVDTRYHSTSMNNNPSPKQVLSGQYSHNHNLSSNMNNNNNSNTNNNPTVCRTYINNGGSSNSSTGNHNSNSNNPTGSVSTATPARNSKASTPSNSTYDKSLQSQQALSGLDPFSSFEKVRT
jgi:hypothetical protein